MSHLSKSVQDLFSTYQTALNSSDLDLAMAMYWPEDGDKNSRAAFTAPHSPPSIGLKAIRSAYEELFAKVEHMVNIEIEHFSLTHDSNWAFVRTRCTGNCRVRATGEELEDDVQGSWVLQRLGGAKSYQDGIWKVTSYHFSSRLPPQ